LLVFCENHHMGDKMILGVAIFFVI